MNRSPDIEELRTFCAAAELGSLGRAKLRLHVSQPALSKRLVHLEAMAGTRLFDRSPRGVKLTPAGRRLYEEARRVLQQVDLFTEVLAGIRQGEATVRLAASHSSNEAFVANLLGSREDGRHPVELVIANSVVVRDLVADGRADLGVAASRPHHTPYPAVRELELAEDAIILAVPATHRWADTQRIAVEQFLSTPIVTRDPASKSRWTVNAVLREHELPPLTPLLEAGTPQAAMREARAHNAPVLLSRQVLRGNDFHEVQIAGLEFPRQFVVVLPAVGEPSEPVEQLVQELRHSAKLWCRAHRLEPLRRLGHRSHGEPEAAVHA